MWLGWAIFTGFFRDNFCRFTRDISDSNVKSIFITSDSRIVAGHDVTRKRRRKKKREQERGSMCIMRYVFLFQR